MLPGLNLRRRKFGGSSWDESGFWVLRSGHTFCVGSMSALLSLIYASVFMRRLRHKLHVAYTVASIYTCRVTRHLEKFPKNTPSSYSFYYQLFKSLIIFWGIEISFISYYFNIFASFWILYIFNITNHRSNVGTVIGSILFFSSFLIFWIWFGFTSFPVSFHFALNSDFHLQ